MKVSAIQKRGNAISFVLEDTDVAVVNALRRVILSDIPNVAFRVDLHGGEGDVEVHRNQSSLHNEFLLHRLSLVPLCFDEKEIEAFDPEKYRFVLKAKNTGTDMLNVTTRDFVILDASGKAYPAAFRDKVFPKNGVTGDHILITKLKPNLSDPAKGDEIHIEARASKDIAKTHVCWSPVSVCTFFNNVDDKLAEQGLRNFLEKHKDLDATEGKQRFDALERQRFFKRNQYDEPNSFTFALESECRMRPEYIFEQAIRVLSAKLQAMQAKLDDAEVNTTPFGIEVMDIPGENHTLGNLIQAMMYNRYVRQDSKVEYVGYYLPHPLEERIVLKVKSSEPSKAIVAETCAYIVEYLNSLLATFNEALG